MEKSVARKSCLVVAPAELPIAPLLEAMRNVRIDPFFLSEFLKSGGKLSANQLRHALRSADFIIALLPGYGQPTNVLFEIGVAVGMRRPLLIFAESGADIPSNISGVDVRY